MRNIIFFLFLSHLVRGPDPADLALGHVGRFFVVVPAHVLVALKNAEEHLGTKSEENVE